MPEKRNVSPGVLGGDQCTAARSSVAAALAARLRQAVQGCTLHIHGPLQAFKAIRSAIADGSASLDGVLLHSGILAGQRMRQLDAEGVSRSDPRWRKEVETAEFCLALLGSKSMSTPHPAELDGLKLGEDLLSETTAPLIAALGNHELFDKLTSLDALRIFMEHHVYAVWDFMTLLKALQQHVTCTTTPWLPTPDPEIRRFINAIVLDEESDEFGGRVGSHFEMYLAAMEEVGAHVDKVNDFTASLRRGNLFSVAAADARVPQAAVEFMSHTLNVVHRGQPHAIATAFTIGREAAIPTMFSSIVAKLVDPGRCPLLLEYLKRHIELDGDKHAPLAARLVRALCGDDGNRWEAAIGAGVSALHHRRRLWDAVARLIDQRRAEGRA